MKDEQIISQMNDFLFRAAKSLTSWLAIMLPKSGADWWNECVMSNLTYSQREIAERNKYDQLTDFDLAALLRITDKSWYIMRGYAYLPTSEREVIRDMITVRNNWAHCSTVLPGKDTIIRDVDTLEKFFSQMNNSAMVLPLEDFRSKVETPNNVNVEQPVDDSKIIEVPSITVTVDNSIIKERDLVKIVGTPNLKGMVFSISELNGTKKYEVFVDGSLKTYYEGQIELEAAPAGYEWVDSATMRSYLTAYQINNPSAGNLYSLNSARIEFVPYQFRPALKLIKSDEPRILIADSVGVGKTIEAGLIIKELQARNDLENVMIICPKPLVSDRKWENEMKRFDEDFIPLEGVDLRQAISDTNRDGEWPARYSKTIVPYSILDSKAYYGEESEKKKRFGFADLDPAPHFDLVIIDEAHHLRNGSMDKERAYSYKCVHYICEHADAVVMLTATPLQTSDDDLYTLLNLLRPDVIIDKSIFSTMLRPNEYISKCSHLIRCANEGWQNETIETLDMIPRTQWGETVISKNPLYQDVRKTLTKAEISREERVKLITDVESLHSFYFMINRTRRKDIQDFCIRRTFTLETPFTEEQRKLHDAILVFEVAALSRLHGSQSVKFMMSTIRRQAASCIFGLAPHIRGLIERRFEQLMDDPDIDYDSKDFDRLDIDAFMQLSRDILEIADNLPEEDPKFESILKVINEKQKLDNNKIIIFSTFRHTLSYVKRKLREEGIRVEQIDGSVNNENRYDLRTRFELPKTEDNAIDVMLFTEVGSEGLDYQFCDMMINYDLPWNPMRIEQRIGRIDRRGQKSETVSIYNAITEGTVDADIYQRCLVRIGVFENSIGECEEILGEIGKQIESIALDSNLNDDERRMKLEQMADNEVRKAQELNKLEDEEKSLFGFDLSNYTVTKEISEAESPFLTTRSIKHMVQMYLNQRIGEGQYFLGESELKTLRLNAFARAELLKDSRSQNGPKDGQRKKWENYLKGNNPNHPITFDSEIASRERNTFFITPVHPLVKQASEYFASNRVAYSHLEYTSDAVPAGDYPMSIYAWNYVGVKSNFKLVGICENEILASELPDFIITAANGNPVISADEKTWEPLENKHIELWKEETILHKQSTEQIANYKLESLKNNYINRKIALERNIAEALDERIRTMRKAELENATERYEQKVAEIKAKVSTADIHTTLIANGIITVK